MKTLALIPALISIISCAGAPQYIPTLNVDHTTISISSSNDSTGTTIQRLDASLYKGMCKIIGDGMHLGFDIENDIRQTIPPALIPTGEEITLSVIYQDVRHMQTRHCNSTVQFIPLPNHDYHAHLFVSNETLKCFLKVNDLTVDETIAIKTPEYACTYTGVAEYKNMQPYIINRTVKVIVN